jgi:hypothetical protein
VDRLSASKRNFARLNKTALGPEVLSEFYIIIFLNKLKIVENTNKKIILKNQKKMSMT